MMNRVLSHPHQRPRGTILHEMLITLTVSVVVLTGVAHLMVFTGQQRRTMSQQTTAAREAGNLMEGFMTRPWDDVTSEKLSATPLSAACSERLPGAELTVQVDGQSDGDDPAKQIAIEIVWYDSVGRPVSPVRLVAWRYPSTEAQP